MKKQSSLLLFILLLVSLAIVGCQSASTPAPANTEAPSAAPTAAVAAASPAPATPGATGAAPEETEPKPTVAPPSADGSRPLAELSPAERADRFSGPAPMSILTGTIYVATIITDKGNIVAELYSDTPQSTNNFVTLAQEGFYDGLTFHRVEPNFVIQGGDPEGSGGGGPGYTIPAEIEHSHTQGALAWARTGDEVNPERRSSGSQFYITLQETPFLDGAYTVFGQVIEGMDVVEQIAVGDKINKIEISTADASQMPTPTPTPEPVAPVPAEGRPLAQEPNEKRAGLYNMPPEMVIDPAKSYQATVSTAKGDIVFDLNTADAAQSVNNFVVLANLGFYDGLPIAYVQPDAYIVLGSPTGDPSSDVGYRLELESNAAQAQIMTGTVGYFPAFNQATQEVRASGSQIFIAVAQGPASSEGSTPLNLFGEVTSGLDVVKVLAEGDTITSIKISEK